MRGGILTLPLLVLAGCLGSPPPGPAADEPGGPAADAVGLPALTLDHCDAAEFGIPAAAAEDVLPDAFVPDDLLPTVHLGLTVMVCPRAVAGNATAEDAALLVAWVRVQPTNASWATAPWSFYVLDLVSSDPHVTQALRQAGAEVRDGQLTRTLASPGLLERWSFDTDACDYLLEWGTNAKAGEATRRDLDRHLWFGSSSYRRLDLHQEALRHVGDDPTPATIGIQGTGAFHDAVGADAALGEGSPREDLRWEIPLRFTTFQR